MLLEALNQGGVYLCCRELQKSIKTSVHSLLVSQIKSMGLEGQFDWGREYLRTKDGKSEFLFFGLRSNSEEIKSTNGVRICWVEEAQAVSQFSLDMLFPTIRENKSEIWFTFNPQDELDPVYEMFVTNPRLKSVVGEINYTDNPWFPDVLEDERLECLRSQPDKYGWIWLGQLYVNVDASVYGKWIEKAKEQGRIRSNLFDPSLPVFTAWDLGYSDDTAIWWFQVAGNEVRLIDYYDANRQDMRHYAEQLYGQKIPEDKITYGANGKVLKFELGDDIPEIAHRKKYTYGGHYVPHDAANKLLQAGGRSIVQQLFEFGIKSNVVPATSQENQYAGARATIDLSWFDADRCKAGIRCLKKYAFEEKEGGGYSKTPKHDEYSHGADSYEVIAQCWKSAIIPQQTAAPRFLEQMTVNELFYGEENHGGYDRI
jgi:phage terminase large subunit